MGNIIRYPLYACLAAVSLAGCMSSSGGGGGDDEEQQAQTIGTTPVTGSIDSASGDQALYAFAAGTAGVYQVLLTWNEPQSDLDLLVVAGNQDSYLTLNANAPSESINVALAAGDVIAIAINAFETNGTAQTYTLSVTPVAAPAHSPGLVESEPNDDEFTPNVFGTAVSGIVTYDVATLSGPDLNDYFVTLAPTAGNYTVQLTWTDVRSDLDLYIGWDTGTASSVQTGTVSESLVQFLNANEQLRVAVNGFDTGGVPQAYELTVTLQ